ncbi:MAG: cytochrome c oxidase assembly factor 1 family protein [Alphaproteobacteria bacterium]|nr:cytochrome c oxidase assembly factor 1 family protein [Alphaproteobacteria bacterium]
MAMEVIRAEPRVPALIGDDVTAGFMVVGSVRDEGETGTARLSIPVHGTAGSATADVSAIRAGGRWELRLLTVNVDGVRKPLVLINPDNERVR